VFSILSHNRLSGGICVNKRGCTGFEEFVPHQLIYGWVGAAKSVDEADYPVIAIDIKTSSLISSGVWV